MTTSLIKQKALSAIMFLLFFFQANAQNSPEVVVVMLGNDKIADVNMDQDKYLAGIKDIMGITEKEFKDIPESQSVRLTVTAHKSGPPTFEFSAAPALDKAREQAFLKKLAVLKPVNTKIVDFSILILLNAKEGDSESEFSQEMDVFKRKKAYEAASLEEKYELTKKWASETVVPVLAAYETIVDDKFAGVKGFGKKTEVTDFKKKQDVTKLTSNNPDYWRAVMEMEMANQLIPITKIFMLASQGEFDHADRYAEIIMTYSRPESVSHEYLAEYRWRMRLFGELLDAEIGKGIAEHDKGNYEKAIKIYNDILKIYPNSAWTLYELYFSKNAMDMKKGLINADDRKQWDAAKVGIYSHNPLYNMDVRASNGKEAYLLFRRHEISGLFKNDDAMLADTFEYADIALDLEIYDFAAQLFWLKFSFDDKDKETALNRYLYCLEKLGVTKLKENFKGDFGKIFKAIDKEKQKTMEESMMYKAMKK